MRTAAVWLSLAWLVTLVVLVPSLRPSFAVIAGCYLLLVGWFLVARSKTLTWRGYARLFSASVATAWLAGGLDVLVSSRLPGGAATDGASIAVAALTEESVKLLPLVLLALLAPGRVRRFAVADWLLAGFAGGLGFLLVEEMLRHLPVTGFVGLFGLGEGASFGWSLLAGGWREGGFVWAGHHVQTALVTAAAGLGIACWRRARRSARGVPRALWRVAAHVPAGALLILLLVVGRLVDVRRQDRFDRGRDLVPGLAWTGTGWASRLTSRLTAGAGPVAERSTPILAGPVRAFAALTGAVALAVAYTARDLAVIVAAHARERGEPVLAGIARSRAAAERSRATREAAQASDVAIEPAHAATRTPGTTATRLGAVTVLGLLVILAVPISLAAAHAIGPVLDNPVASPFLGGILDAIGAWWNHLTPAEQFALFAAALVLLVVLGMSPGGAFFALGIATYLLDHMSFYADVARNPRRTVGRYFATRTPLGIALDAVQAAMTFIPGGTGGRLLRRLLDDEARNPATWRMMIQGEDEAAVAARTKPVLDPNLVRAADEAEAAADRSAEFARRYPAEANRLAALKARTASDDATVAAFREQNNHIIDSGLRSSDPGLRTEARAADAIRDHVVRMNRKVAASGGEPPGEVDIETRRAVIEVTSGRGGKLEQLTRYLSDPHRNHGKQVVLYAPRYKKFALHDVEALGVRVARNPTELRRLLRELGEG